MNGFNKIHFQYKSDFRQKSLREVFNKWANAAGPLEMKNQYALWASGCPYHISIGFTENHVILERRGQIGLFVAYIEIQYRPSVTKLEVSITSSYGSFIYLLLPLAFLVFLHNEIFAFEKNGYYLFLGLIVGTTLLLAMILSLSSREKKDIQRDIEEQLLTSRIMYEILD